MARKCCCGPCDKGDITIDGFNGPDLNSRWVQSIYGSSNPITFVGGRLRVTTNGPWARKRCHAPPGGDITFVAVEIGYVNDVQHANFFSMHLRSSNWIEILPDEESKYRTIISVFNLGHGDDTTLTDSKVTCAFRDQDTPANDQDSIPSSPTFTGGDKLRIEFSKVSDGIWDISYLLNSTVVDTFTNVEWEWLERVYVDFQTNPYNGTLILDLDDYKYEQS